MVHSKRKNKTINSLYRQTRILNFFIQKLRFSTNYDVVERKYDIGESWWNYLVCTKNKNLDRNQHTRDY